MARSLAGLLCTNTVIICTATHTVYTIEIEYERFFRVVGRSKAFLIQELTVVLSKQLVIGCTGLVVTSFRRKFITVHLIFIYDQERLIKNVSNIIYFSFRRFFGR